MKRSIILASSLFLLLAVPPVLTWPTELLRQADLLVEQREYGRALERYALVLRLGESPYVHTSIGNAHLQKNQPDEARTHFELALALDPKDAEALLGLGRVALKKGRHTEAIDLLERAHVIRPASNEIGYQLGIAYLQDLEFERAATIFGGLIDAGRGNVNWEPRARYNLGLAYLARGVDAASAEFAAVHGDAEVDGMARLMQGVTEELNTRPGDEAYRAARLGQALLQVGQQRLARWYLEKAVARRPDYADARAHLGYAYWREGRQEEALETLYGAVDLDRSSPSGHYFLGVVLRGQRRLPEAIAELKEAVRLDEGSAEAYVELARTFALQSQYAAARDAFATAMRLRPDDVGTKLAAIWFHLDHLFDVERAMEIGREAARIAPESADVKDAIGWALYVNGRVDEAEEALRQAVQAAPFAASARYHLGVLLESRGNAEEAAAEYRRAIDLDAEGRFASRAAAAIKAMRGG